MHTNEHVCAFLFVSVLMRKCVCVRGFRKMCVDRKVGLAILPLPAVSGLNFNYQEVPHARDSWVLSV